MATTIGSLNYRVFADTKQFTEGMKLTGAELRKSAKLMRDMRTPTERLSEATSELNNMKKAGAIDEKTYAAALNKVQLEYEQLEESAKKAANATSEMEAATKRAKSPLGTIVKLFEKAHPIVHTVSIGINAISSGLGAMKDNFLAITEGFSGLSEMALFQERLSLSGREFGALRVMASDLTFDVEKVVDGAAELTKRIAEAARIGQGTGFDALGDEGLGLTIDQMKELSRLNPFEQAQAVAKMIQGVDDFNEQLRLTDELFATEELERIARMSADQFEAAAQRAEKLNLVLEDSPLQQIKETASAFGDMKLAIQGVTQTFLTVGAKPFQDIATALKEIAIAFADMIKNNPDVVIDTLEALRDAVRDVTTMLGRDLGTGVAILREQGPVGAAGIGGLDLVTRNLPGAGERSIVNPLGGRGPGTSDAIGRLLRFLFAGELPKKTTENADSNKKSENHLSRIERNTRTLEPIVINRIESFA